MLIKSLPLKELIEICVNPADPQWHKAWDFFLNRYKPSMYFFVRRSCQSWQLERLKVQLKDVVNDIYSEVIIIIYKKLETFNNRDSEVKLLAWLQVICNRTTAAHLQRKLKNIFHDETLDDFAYYKVTDSDMHKWELYENLISELRIVLGKKKNTEWYIHIFMLRIWAGFSARQLLRHPCYRRLSENSINVIINRLREKLS